MGRIRHLEPHMINMIAAGEVIERPASVVKELLENSLDAQATRVTVAVSDGGRREIQVTDDGCGMGAADLAVAFDTHATSKIHGSEDLRAIGTLGFRGEALASVAAVARVRAVTRTTEQPEAHSLEIDCGQRGPVRPASGPVGTHITVSDLFYKLPARRKFLRTAATEMGHVQEQFIRVALGSLANAGRPPASLQLRHNGREVYDVAATDDLRIRVRTLFPTFAGGSEAGWIPVERVEGDLHLWGLLGHPDLARSNGRFQYLFLNGRFVRDRTLTHAVKEAYRGLLEPNRFPVLFLFLDMPLDAYDVNVHPTKTEVRFYDGQRMHSQVLACVREHLLGVDLHASGTLPPGRDVAGVDPVRSGRESVRQAMGDFFRVQRADPAAPRAASPAVPAYGPAATAPVASRSRAAAPLATADWAAATAAAATRVLQVHDSYIVAETAEGLIIVDQHALHEKILYERLSRQLAGEGLTAQRLLIPPTLNLSPAQAELLDSHADLLTKLGIEVAPFGPQTYAIQTFPALLRKAEPVDFVQQLVDVLGESRGIGPERILDAVVSMAACKAAIKAHQPLTRAEIEQLLADGRRAESSARCPHGRPTTIRFSLHDLEKQFLRT